MQNKEGESKGRGLQRRRRSALGAGALGSKGAGQPRSPGHGWGPRDLPGSLRLPLPATPTLTVDGDSFAATSLPSRTLAPAKGSTGCNLLGLAAKRAFGHGSHILGGEQTV